MLLFFFEFISDQIEKCSESTGMKLVLYLLSSFFIISQAHIIDSLFAIAIVFVCWIIFIVGTSPLKPLIALIV